MDDEIKAAVVGHASGKLIRVSFSELCFCKESAEVDKYGEGLPFDAEDICIDERNLLNRVEIPSDTADGSTDFRIGFRHICTVKRRVTLMCVVTRDMLLDEDVLEDIRNFVGLVVETTGSDKYEAMDRIRESWIFDHLLAIGGHLSERAILEDGMYANLRRLVQVKGGCDPSTLFPPSPSATISHETLYLLLDFQSDVVSVCIMCAIAGMRTLFVGEKAVQYMRGFEKLLSFLNYNNFNSFAYVETTNLPEERIFKGFFKGDFETAALSTKVYLDTMSEVLGLTPFQQDGVDYRCFSRFTLYEDGRRILPLPMPTDGDIVVVDTDIKKAATAVGYIHAVSYDSISAYQPLDRTSGATNPLTQCIRLSNNKWNRPACIPPDRECVGDVGKLATDINDAVRRYKDEGSQASMLLSVIVAVCKYLSSCLDGFDKYIIPIEACDTRPVTVADNYNMVSTPEFFSDGTMFLYQRMLQDVAGDRRQQLEHILRTQEIRALIKTYRLRPKHLIRDPYDCIFSTIYSSQHGAPDASPLAEWAASL